MLECGGQKAARTSFLGRKKKQTNQKESNKAQRERKVYVLNVKRSLLRTNVCGRKNLPSERDLTLQRSIYIREREIYSLGLFFGRPPPQEKQTKKI